mmetsp:Transcript_22198/g.44925  ORF Transcript_22198/g.44925 Transcript_22198/m.44925 type:complete len:212 (+) Transcript_22198:274-909(+)
MSFPFLFSPPNHAICIKFLQPWSSSDYRRLPAPLSLPRGHLLLVHIGKEQFLGVGHRLEPLREHVVSRQKLALRRLRAVHIAHDLLELDPSVLLRRLVGRGGHDEGDEAVDPRAGDGCVVDEGLTEGDRLGDVGLHVAGEEEVEGHVGVAGEVGLVKLGGVGVDVVGGDHAGGAEDLGPLVVSVGGLAADVDHGLDAVGVADDAGGGVEGL